MSNSTRFCETVRRISPTLDTLHLTCEEVLMYENEAPFVAALFFLDPAGEKVISDRDLWFRAKIETYIGEVCLTNEDQRTPPQKIIAALSPLHVKS